LLYANRGLVAFRREPAQTDRERLNYQVDRTVELFTQRTLQLSPPIIMQTARKVGSCDGTFENTVVDRFMEAGLEERCTGLYTCPSLTAQDIYSCSAGQQKDTHLGLSPVQFVEDGWDEDDAVYVDFLATAVNGNLLGRSMSTNNTQVLSSYEFVDGASDVIRLKTLFHSVQYGVTTGVEVKAQASGPKVDISYSIRHFIAIHDPDTYTIIQALAIINVVFMFLDNVVLLRHLFFERRALGRKASFFTDRWFLCFLDFALMISVLILIALQLPSKRNSFQDQRTLVDSLLNLEWSSQSVGLDETKAACVGKLQEFETMLSDAEMVDRFALWVLLALLCRILMSTGAHPRIALLTSTIRKGFEDFCHFLLIFIPCFAAFAAVAAWRYGGSRSDLQNVGEALASQFDALLGPPGNFDSASNNSEFLAYSSMFFAFMFFLMLNFVLAIIVDSYEKVREAIEVCQVEQSIVEDIYVMLSYRARRFIRWSSRQSAWPPLGDIVVHLSSLEPKPPKVSYAHLMRPTTRGGRLFKTPAAAKSWIDFYDAMPFLWPESAEKEEKVVDYEEIHHRVGQAMEATTTGIRGFEQRLNLRLNNFEAALKEVKKGS